MNLHLLTLVFALIVGCLMCVLVLAIYLIVRLLVYIFRGRRVSVNPFWYVCLLCVLVSWVVIGYGYWVGRFEVAVRATEYKDARLPVGFDGYKIVHISDLHLSTYADRPSGLQAIVDSINAQSADLICFTGDIVSLGTDEAYPFAEILRGMVARDGVLSVLGNHDLMIYRDMSISERNEEVARLVGFERDSLGWTVLRDSSRVLVRSRVLASGEELSDSLTFVGVDNCSCEGQGFRSVYHGDLSSALCGTSGYRLLLTHDPTHWRAEVCGQRDIWLTLSGHTHSGQCCVFGYPLARLLFEESAGWYYLGSQGLYVTSGVGCTLPVRVNCPSEITVITLRR